MRRFHGLLGGGGEAETWTEKEGGGGSWEGRWTFFLMSLSEFKVDKGSSQTTALLIIFFFFFLPLGRFLQDWSHGVFWNLSAGWFRYKKDQERKKERKEERKRKRWGNVPVSLPSDSCFAQVFIYDRAGSITVTADRQSFRIVRSIAFSNPFRSCSMLRSAGQQRHQRRLVAALRILRSPIQRQQQPRQRPQLQTDGNWWKAPPARQWPPNGIDWFLAILLFDRIVAPPASIHPHRPIYIYILYINIYINHI